MTGYTSISVATLVCAWVLICFVSVATTISIIEEVRERRAALKEGKTWTFSRYDMIYTWCAFVIALAMAVQTTWAVVDEGQGEHIDQESRSQAEKAAKSLFINECLWTIVNTLARLAAFDMLRRIFGFKKVPRCRYVILSILAAVHGFGTLLAGLLVCTPLNAAWDLNSSGSCKNETETFVACEVIGLMLDLSLFIAPILAIAKLKLSPLKRLKISLIFSFGSLVTIITSLRLAALWRVNSRDMTYDRGYLGLLTIVGSLAGLLLGDVKFFTRIVNGLRKQRPNSQANRTPYQVNCTLPEYEAVSSSNPEAREQDLEESRHTLQVHVTKVFEFKVDEAEVTKVPTAVCKSPKGVNGAAV